MGKSSSAKAEVTEYRMSMHIGVSLELDSIRKIIVDEKQAWAGNVTNNTTLTINRPDLFGGEKKEGGLVGAIDVLMGRSNQILPALAAARYRKASNDCPGFRGLTTLMFRGSGQVSAGQFNIWQYLAGTWPGVGANGFVWKHNSPIIAQKIEVEGTCAPKTALNPAYAMIANPEHPTRPDANPIHIIYEALIDDEFGMGGSPDALDIAAFEAAAQTLYNENFGLTILWMRQSSIEDLVNEILQHIQATLFADPTTGLLSIKLHRDDYAVEDLFVISPDNATLAKYRVRSPGEIINAITLSWTNPENEQAESITAHNLASIANQGGETVPSTRDYYGIRNSKLAREVLARDLRESSAPLVSCEATIDRSAWHLKPGDVVLLNWPRRSLYGLVMRVGKVNYGKPGSTTVRVPLVQDVFSLSHPPIVIDPGTGWVDPSADPKPLTMQLTTLPAYFSRNASLQTTPVSLVEPEVLVMSLADSQDNDSLDYELVAQTPGPDGEPLPLSRGAMTMTPLAYLGATLQAAATSELPSTLFPDINWAPVIGGFVFLGYGDTNQEIALVTGITDTGWTIARGCLDTSPRTWAAGTPVWAVNPGSSVVDVQTVHAAGETVTYRGLDRTSKGLLAFDDAPDVTATLTERPHLPLRPANVKVGGVGFGSYAIGAAATFEISWSTRNRRLEDTQVMRWTDGPVAPEYRQETIVRAYDVATDALVHERAYLWLDNSVVFQKADFDRYGSVRFQVLSRRDELESLAGHSVVVTGFANNPAAPLPPAGPARTPPPSIVVAPAEGAFVAVPVTQTGDNRAQTFSIEIAGTQDRLNVDSLVARYRVLGDVEWTKLPSVALDGEAVVVAIPGLRPATVYETGVAYVEGGVVGQFRDLADVMTGNSTPITGGDLDTTPPANVGTVTLSQQAVVTSDGTTIVQVTADWPDNVESDLDGYLIEWLEGGVSKVFRPVAASRDLYTVRPGVAVSVEVFAVDKLGNRSVSPSVASLSGLVLGDTMPPGDVTSPFVQGSIGLIAMRWVNPTDADFWRVLVYRNTSGTSPAVTGEPPYAWAAGTNFIDEGVVIGTTYHYWTRSQDRSGNVGNLVSMGSGIARKTKFFDDIAERPTVLDPGYFDAGGFMKPIGIRREEGILLDDRWPQEAGANVTENRTAALVQGQGALATRNNVDFNTHVATYPERLRPNPTYGGDFFDPSRVLYGTGAYIDDLRPGEFGANVTENRTAALIVNQAPTATNSDFSAVTGPTKPADNAGTTLVLTPYNANTEIQGNNVRRVSGRGWDTGATSQALNGPSYCSARLRGGSSGHLTNYLMFGLADTFNGSYETIDYAFFTTGDGYLYIYESGVAIGYHISPGGWNGDDVLSIVYDGVNVRYQHNGVVLRTVATTPGRRLFFATSIDNADGGLRDVQFGPAQEAPRIDRIWNTVGNSQYGQGQLVTAEGTAALVAGQSRFATQSVAEYSSNAAALAAGHLGKVFYNTTTTLMETCIDTSMVAGTVKQMTSGAGAANVSSTAYSAVGNCYLELAMSLDGGSLDADTSWNGTVTLEEYNAGSGWRTVGTASLVVASSGLDLGGGVYQSDGGSAQIAGTGIRTGSVTYRVTVTRTSGSNFVAGAVINAILKITPIS